MNEQHQNENREEHQNIQENFHAGALQNERSWISNDNRVQDSSGLNSQFKCLQSKRQSQELYSQGGLNINKRKDIRSALFPNDTEETKKNFTAFSIIWIILPVLNLLWEISLEVIGIVMFLVKEIFNTTYKMITKPIMNIFGYNQGANPTSKSFCFNYSWVRYVTLVLCPPAAVFMAYGLIGWYQIIICSIATLFYYFPGLAYAIIVIGRSEVNTYMKKFKEGDGCNNNKSSSAGFFISSKDNQPKCVAKSGDTCTPEGVEIAPGKLDCCAQPYLDNGVWLRDGKPALDSGGNEIKKYEDGEMHCKNDTKKIKMPKGICVFKKTGKPGP